MELREQGLGQEEETERKERGGQLRYEAIYYRKLAIVENAVQLKKGHFAVNGLRNVAPRDRF